MGVKDIATHYIAVMDGERQEAEKIGVHYRMPAELKARIERVAELANQYESRIVVDLLEEGTHDLAAALIDNMGGLSERKRKALFKSVVYGDDSEQEAA